MTNHLCQEIQYLWLLLLIMILISWLGIDFCKLVGKKFAEISPRKSVFSRLSRVTGPDSDTPKSIRDTNISSLPWTGAEIITTVADTGALHLVKGDIADKSLEGPYQPDLRIQGPNTPRIEESPQAPKMGDPIEGIHIESGYLLLPGKEFFLLPSSSLISQ